MGEKTNASALSGAARRVATALSITALTVGSASAGTPLAAGAQKAAGDAPAKVWFGGGETEAPVVLAQSVYHTEEQLERMRNDRRAERRYERKQEQVDYDNARAGIISRREYHERRRGGALHGKGYGKSLDRGYRRGRGRHGGRYYDDDHYYGGDYGGGYYYGGDPYYDYEKRRRRERRKDLAIGVIGSIIGLGAAAARSGAGPRGYSGGGGGCDYWASQCAKNWGRNNNNFYGCLRYHNCN